MRPITLSLKPLQVTKIIMEELHTLGLIMLFKPTPATLQPPSGENVGDVLYVSREDLGPHKLTAIGVSKTTVRLGVHPDSEEFLIPDYGSEARPFFLVICRLPADEIHKRDTAGTLTEDDFICLNMYPCPRGVEMFTMLKGTVHCEATHSSDRPVGVFFVTEARDLTVDWIDLENTRLVIE
jgi:hypothetical protein